MVLAIRRGSSLRRVASRFGVSHMTVQRWCKRAAGMRLSRADLSSRPAGSRRPPNRTARTMEQRILAIRRRLQVHSALGEHGARAIRAELGAQGMAPVPSARTIGRILLRNGLLDGRRRVRRPPPPKGWYLPDVAAGQADVDSFDTITDLVIRGGKDVTVLNGISLHGGLPVSWPRSKITAKIVVKSLLEHWGAHGRPQYAKFDNDTIFQGAHQWPDSFNWALHRSLPRHENLASRRKSSPSMAGGGAWSGKGSDTGTSTACKLEAMPGSPPLVRDRVNVSPPLPLGGRYL